MDARSYCEAAETMGKKMVPLLYHILKWREQVMRNIVKVFRGGEDREEKFRTIL
jgi:hypothetical protein